LGVAPGVDLLAMQGSDVHEMGAEVSLAAGATLWARSPDAPTPGQNASWTDGTAAVIEATVHRSHGDETVAVASVTGPGAWLEVPLDAPGSYQLEVTVQPLHLVEALGSAHAYAQNTYRWVETGAIRVVSP